MTEYPRGRKAKIAIFDYYVRPDSAPGGCHLRMIEGLAEKYEFTVFAVEFENPAPSHIKFVHIPAPERPTILLTCVFHLLAPLYYWMYRWKHRIRFDLVERMEVSTFLGSLTYIHFCHRAYLKNHWDISRPTGLRGLLRGLDHMSRAYCLEPVLYRLARKLAVPSQGLARELIEAYPFTKEKIYLLPNSADYERLSNAPPDFDRDNFRAELGSKLDDLVLVFIALGQFERKGLPQLLAAISLLGEPNIRLVVVGGSSYWIEQYVRRAEDLGIRDQVDFAGMHRDVAPFLWAADVFTLPSLYEVFPLVVLEAAAAGCAMLVTHLNGVEEYIEDGTSGIYVDRTVEAIANGILAMHAMGPEGRSKLGKAAQRAASRYSREAFVANWDTCLKEQLSSTRYGSVGPNERSEYERA